MASVVVGATVVVGADVVEAGTVVVDAVVVDDEAVVDDAAVVDDDDPEVVVAVTAVVEVPFDDEPGVEELDELSSPPALTAATVRSATTTRWMEVVFTS